MKKEITKNRKEKRQGDIEKIRKYRDKNGIKLKKEVKVIYFATKKWIKKQ
jgi:hypothetical protein